MLENLFINALYGLGLVVVLVIIVVVIDATRDVLKKRKIANEINERVLQKIKEGDFHVLGKCEFEDLENKEDNS